MKLPNSATEQYLCTTNLNLYDSPNCEALATQAASGRQVKLASSKPTENAIEICCCEDNYVAWLPMEELVNLKPAPQPYQPLSINRAEIVQRIPKIIQFTREAMAEQNYYVWGGTVAPNYDCSGLMQAAFAASGIWLPRDSYQQEAFTKTISLEETLPGDLIFFAQNQKVNHVALHLGDGYYIHSSGTQMGRNGIGIDKLSNDGDKVSQDYYKIFWNVGRVMSSYT